MQCRKNKDLFEFSDKKDQGFCHVGVQPIPTILRRNNQTPYAFNKKIVTGLRFPKNEVPVPLK